MINSPIRRILTETVIITASRRLSLHFHLNEIHPMPSPAWPLFRSHFSAHYPDAEEDPMRSHPPLIVICCILVVGAVTFAFRQNIRNDATAALHNLRRRQASFPRLPSEIQSSYCLGPSAVSRTTEEHAWCITRLDISRVFGTPQRQTLSSRRWR